MLIVIIYDDIKKVNEFKIVRPYASWNHRLYSFIEFLAYHKESADNNLLSVNSELIRVNTNLFLKFLAQIKKQSLLVCYQYPIKVYWSLHHAVQKQRIILLHDPLLLLIFVVVLYAVFINYHTRRSCNN